MEIKNIQSDQDFQKVMDSVNKYIDAINKYQEDNPHLVQPTAMELAQFHKSHFYHNWLHRYRRLFAFGSLGNHGVIAIPNTTFEEWLYWFSEWAEAFMDDYNAFKKLVFEALLLIEKHLEAIDAELQNHEERITANEAHLAAHDEELANHQKHLEDLDKGLADETKARQDADTAEKNARESKDNDLQNQINQEKTDRGNAIQNVQQQINQEKTDRQNADQGLQNQVNNLGNKVDNNTRAISNIAKISMKVGFDHNIDWNSELLSKGWQHTQYYEAQDKFTFAYSFIDTDGDNKADYLSFNTQLNGWKGTVNSTKPGGYWGSVSDPSYRERYGYEMVNFNAAITDAKLDSAIKYLANNGGDFTELNGVKYNKVLDWQGFINNINVEDHNENDIWYVLPCVTPQGTLRMLLLTQGGADLVNKDVRFNDMRYTEPQYIDIKGANIEL